MPTASLWVRIELTGKLEQFVEEKAQAQNMTARCFILTLIEAAMHAEEQAQEGTCQAEGCGRPVEGKGWTACLNHAAAAQWKREGKL